MNINNKINKIVKYPQIKLTELQLKLLNAKPIFDIELSSRCNISCQFCPRDQLSKNNQGMMTKTTIRKVVSWLPSGATVMLSGLGEPLLNKNLTYLVEGLRKKNIRITLYTNGLLATPNRIKTLIQKGLNEIQISLPALDIKKYTMLMPGSDLKTVLSNIKYLSKNMANRVSLRLNMIVDRMNKGETAKLLELANTFNYRMSIRRIHSRAGHVRTERTIPELYACGVLASVHFISWDGKIMSCVNDIARKKNLGMIFEKSFQKILEKKKTIITQNKWFEYCTKCNDDSRYLILFHGGVDFDC